MCYKKPGPRCSAHAKEALVKAGSDYQAELAASSTDHEKIAVVKEKYDKARDDYDATPEGIALLQAKAKKAEEEHDGFVEEYKNRLDSAIVRRDWAMHHYEIAHGDAASYDEEGNPIPVDSAAAAKQQKKIEARKQALARMVRDPLRAREIETDEKIVSVRGEMDTMQQSGNDQGLTQKQAELNELEETKSEIASAQAMQSARQKANHLASTIQASPEDVDKEKLRRMHKEAVTEARAHANILKVKQSSLDPASKAAKVELLQSQLDLARTSFEGIGEDNGSSQATDRHLAAIAAYDATPAGQGDLDREIAETKARMNSYRDYQNRVISGEERKAFQAEARSALEVLQARRERGQEKLSSS